MTTDTKTEDKNEQGEHYEGTEIKGGLSIYDQFANELDARAESIASMLPSTVTPARFKNTVIAAIRQDPSILQATIRSVMGAVIRAAQDGLVPDGREGHIAIYNTNVAKRDEKARWEKRAQWNPMAGGLRKRLRELDNIIANAEVVYEKDTDGHGIIWEQGDDPKIIHRPAKLGSDRGKMVGAYCIYRKGDDILHREVMDFTQIETTRKQSKQPDSLMWSKFPEEGYRKVVLRRGIKTVPVTDQMREIVRRDDEDNFEFANRAETGAIIPPTPPAPPPPPAVTQQSEPPKMPEVAEKAKAPAPRAANRRRPIRLKQEPESPVATGALPGDWQSYVDNMVDEIKAAETASNENAVHETFADTISAAIEQGRLLRADAELVREAWDKAVSGLPPRVPPVQGEVV